MDLKVRLAFNTSSTKKRKISREPTGEDILPSCEEDLNPCFSFSADQQQQLSSGLSSPTYVRGDSLPASSLPRRLQVQTTTNYCFAASDATSSAASSPAAASTDLSRDTDRLADFFPAEPENSSLLAASSLRAVMNGSADYPRSASPLKRRASSLDREEDADSREDVDMIPVPPVEAPPEADDDVDEGVDVKEEVRQSVEVDDVVPDDTMQEEEHADARPNSPSSLSVETGTTGIAPLIDDTNSMDTAGGSPVTDQISLVDTAGPSPTTEQSNAIDTSGPSSVTEPIVSMETSDASPAADSTTTVDTPATSMNPERAKALDSLGPLTRGRTQRTGRTWGCVGLSNMGNTCYLNSALQCLIAVPELTQYLRTGEGFEDLNVENPIGYSGEVARAYMRLLEEIFRWPPPSSVTPSNFRRTIGKYRRAFAGCEQQDSQEFIGFLLDGLQEDLSRVKSKPYIEKPESTDDMISNPEAIREMAEKVWDITKKRNDSVIADLFTGMYKSTLVCPECGKVSITFDPFNNLTLPLPVENAWTKAVKFFPLNDRPVKINVEIDKSSSILALKQFISSRVGVPVERLFAAEEFRDKFFKIYDDNSCVNDEIQSSDTPTIHELEAAPTNANPLKKKKKPRSLLLDQEDVAETPSWDSPLAERMVVPVIHRQNPPGSSFRPRGKRDSPTVPPHFILLTPEEARNEDAIRRKILEKVATFSTWPNFSELEDSDSGESTDPDLTLADASDADLSGDGKGETVVAKSVEGEEDMVDVSRKDASPQTHPEQTNGEKFPQQLKTFNTRRPSWVNPSVFLDGIVQNMFQLSYFKEHGSTVPSGWSAVSDNTHLPRLETRKPEIPITVEPDDDDADSPSTWGNGTASEEDTNTEDAPSPVTRMNDESSDEDEPQFPPVQNLPLRSPQGTRPNLKGGRGGKKKMKSYKTYSKKGKKRLDKQMRAASRHQEPQTYQAQDTMESGPDDGPLIRLGEGLVVDWDPEAYDVLFGKTPSDNMDGRGAATFVSPPTLLDPVLDAKKKARAARGKKGITLDDCLDEFEKEEILSEQDMWYCPRCKDHRRASKKFDLWKTPDILIVHLKRFSASGWRREKIDTLVDYPVEGLDLTKRVLDRHTGKEEIYDLIAVDKHWGSLNGGHYTAVTKNFIDGCWYDYNDTIVSKVSDASKAVTTAAYLLFYRRRTSGGEPLGGPRFKEVKETWEKTLQEKEADSE
ncbi:Ubiquitin specific peptidase 11 [Pleurostoma richardsiae]|uniref:ubiquitinyl hydrolase 1 n=1 Tax=Pleurostoma richardsiae TaxID=41990 RepID=A0AA38VKA4_9PEZI|nr:Ubiquitin specific peptidase 11 [Pleurostoma richardsiae]